MITTPFEPATRKYCRSVFQYLHRLNIVGVDIVEVSTNAIDDDQEHCYQKM